MNKFLITALLLFCPTLVFAFPNTNVFYSCTGADTSSGLGGNWTVDATHNDVMGISSNRCYLTNSINNAQDYWNPTKFGGQIESYVTATSLQNAGGGVRLLMTTDTASHNGYEIFSNSPAGSISLFRVDADATISLLGVVQAFSAGDSVGFSRDNNTGKMVLWYESGSGAYTNLGTVTDTTYTVKYLAFNVGNTFLRFKNFGGGYHNGYYKFIK